MIALEARSNRFQGRICFGDPLLRRCAPISFPPVSLYPMARGQAVWSDSGAAVRLSPPHARRSPMNDIERLLAIEATKLRNELS